MTRDLFSSLFFPNLRGEGTELVALLHDSQKPGHVLKAEARF